MTDSVVVEGLVKIRDGKKWKSRWVVLRKPSPVADCLVVLVYKERGERASGQRERSSVTLEHIYGLEPCVAYEGLSLGLSLTILCLTQSVALGFDCKETLQVWEIRLRYSLGEVHRFAVGVLPGTKVETGPATLYLCNNLLVIARDLPPVIIGQWNLLDLRRYGPVTNGFVFEGGTRCGYWAGVFFLSCAEGEQISFLFDCIVRGISPSRGPFGLRPLLPDPNTSPVSVEERLNHETQELEKRLSMLSHCSHNSTVSTSSYCTSMAGDDRSISGSSDTSDTSQSDSSMGSRLAIWTDPSSSSTAPTEGGNQSGQKSTLLLVDEKLPITMGGGGARLSVSTATTSSSSTNKQGSRSRRLQEIGRQSSSDSGIATGSHSSYSGSFSSYTSSLDVTGSGGGVGVGGGVVGSSSGAGTGAGVGEDYASVLNLQTTSTTLGSGGGGGTTTTGTASAVLPERTLCTCPPCPGHEYQVPSTALRYLYDTPRSLMMLLPQLPGSTPTCSSRCAHDEEDEEEGQGQGQVQPTPSGGAQVSCTTYGHVPQGAQLCCISGSHVGCGQLDRLQEQQHRPDGCSALKDSEASQGKAAAAVSAAAGGGGGRLSRGNSSEGAPPGVEGVEVCDICTPRAIYTSCPICGGLKGTPVLTPGVPSVPDKKKQRCKGEPAYEVMESRTTERGSEAEEKSKYELMGSYGHQRIPHIDLEGGVFVFPPDVSLMSERPKGDGVIYVNIPISPSSKKQLNYMELELQEATTTAVRGRGSTKYAQIDITATETAHKVGTQHALGREEGLLKLEQKRRGGLPQ